MQKATRILDCGIYRTDGGLEVRAGYGRDDLLYSMWITDVANGRALAASLHRTVRDKGGFEDLPIGG